MQNPLFVEQCAEEMMARFSNVEIIRGDRYHPILALKLHAYVPPESVCERQFDITIPMARCGGYMPDACLAGLHIHSKVHGLFNHEKTIIPFCDPVEDTSWMVKTVRFYPFYQSDPDALIGTSYLCLNDPAGQPTTPLALMDTAIDYLANWLPYAMNLAVEHGAVARGEKPGDSAESVDWVDHLVEHASPGLEKKLLELAYPT